MILAHSGSQRHRRGAVGPLTAIMLLPMIAMVAMACDIGYIWRTEAELQNAADSAALAGCSRLLDPNVTLVTPVPIVSGTLEYIALLTSARTNAVATAQQYGGYHKGADVGLVINASDVEVGYIQDPTALSSTTAGQFQTGVLAPFPNAVRATARRDSSTSTGAFGLFFTRIFGVASAERSATATACLRGGTIPGFDRPARGLLPIGMRKTVYDWLFDPTNPLPSGTADQDDYRVANDVKPPDNVTRHNNNGDGKKEAVIFTGQDKGGRPDGSDELEETALTAGNFGLINLANVANGSASEIQNWIQNGLSEADLTSWGAGGLKVPGGGRLAMGGQTGLEAKQEAALQSIIGQPRIMPVFDSLANPGSNATFQVVGFVGVVIVEAQLTGNNKRVVVQVMRAIEPGVAITNTTTVGDPTFIYQGISLCR